MIFNRKNAIIEAIMSDWNLNRGIGQGNMDVLPFAQAEALTWTTGYLVVQAEMI